MSAADGRGRRRSSGRPSGAKGGGGSGAAGRGSKSNGSGGGGGGERKMTIGSDFSEARDVQRMIRDEVERLGYDADSQFAIKLALEEALINAIKHGNKLDKSKRVHVEWRVTRDAADITIEDEGPGFDRASVPDPTDEDNLEKLTGRGILLIESYMSSVEYSKGGRRVRLIRKNAARKSA